MLYHFLRVCMFCEAAIFADRERLLFFLLSEGPVEVREEWWGDLGPVVCHEDFIVLEKGAMNADLSLAFLFIM